MNEQEWLTCTDPARMIRSLQGRGGSRRPRLWTCAFFRWYYSDVGMSMRAVQVAEAWADGQEPTNLGDLSGFLVTDRVAWRAAERTARSVASYEESAQKQNAIAFQIKSLYCVFGNPFRPIAFDPTWLEWNHGSARKLAQAIYDDRAFDQLPILTETLEHAGCDNADILSHCRSEGPHVRGCWVVDLILGKK
jgi:hypothetical protein